MAKVLLVRLKAFDHKRRASPCAKMTGDKVSPERAKAFALSGRTSYVSFSVGRCPTLVLKPFQGENV